jgi:hypothetical protein
MRAERDNVLYIMSASFVQFYVTVCRTRQNYISWKPFTSSPVVSRGNKNVAKLARALRNIYFRKGKKSSYYVTANMLRSYYKGKFVNAAHRNKSLLYLTNHQNL